MKKIMILILLCESAFRILAQDSSIYQREIFIRNGDTLRYRILYPENPPKDHVYPLVVFLHGSGEQGSDNALQLLHGGDLFLKENLRKQFPAVVIFPQCPLNDNWSKFPDLYETSAAFNQALNTRGLSTPELLVKLLMDSLVMHNRIDKKRIYLGGLSLGGYGVYDLVIHFPGYFAAAFPICGQANVTLYAKKAAHVPLWIFHGAKDDAVSPQPDRDLIKTLQSEGIKTAKYTEYPDANHDSWDSAFAEPDLLPWLFSQQK